MSVLPCTRINKMSLPSFLPLLITGVTGVPGYSAFRYFHAKYPNHVTAIRPVRYWPLRDEGIVPLDIEDRRGLAILMKQKKFRSVLNGAGSCALKSCEMNPVLAYRVNVQSALNVLEMVHDHDVRFIHLSTDLVFSGKPSEQQYREEDSVSPVTVYGKTMAIAEEVVLLKYPSAAIFRISLPMGISVNGHAGAIDWILSRFKKNNPATLYFDELRSPFYCEDFNRVIELTFHNTMNGIYHLGSHRHLSLYQIGQIVNKVGGYDPQLLRGCMRKEAGPMPPRAGNVTMSNGKLIKALGTDPFRKWPYLDSHVPDGLKWHYDRPDHVSYHPEQIHKCLYRIPAPA